MATAEVKEGSVVRIENEELGWVNDRTRKIKKSSDIEVSGRVLSKAQRTRWMNIVRPLWMSNQRFSISVGRGFQALNSVVFAASADATRHMLNGVYFESDENGCRVVATDGRRLSVCSIEDGEHPKAGVILPTLAADLIIEAASSQEEVEFLIADSYVLLVTKTTQVFSKPIAAEFPDYRKVIPSPEDTNRIATFDKVD